MTGQEKRATGSSSTWDQNTWRNTHTQTHTVFKAVELQIRPKTKPIALLTNIVLSPSPKMTGTSFLLAPPRTSSCALSRAARRVEGQFAQCCPSEINIKDYWLYSLVKLCSSILCACVYCVLCTFLNV